MGRCKRGISTRWRRCTPRLLSCRASRTGRRQCSRNELDVGPHHVEWSDRCDVVRGIPARTGHWLCEPWHDDGDIVHGYGRVAEPAYLYKVRAINAGGSADSAPDLATTVIFTDDPLVAGSTIIKAVHLAELRTAVNAVRALAGLAAATFTDAATPGVIVKAVHINELRTDLDQAMSALGFPTGGYTDTLTAGVVIKAIHFQEIRNRVK